MMKEEQMEENEIKEGHDDVAEKQDNKAKETPIANRKVLLEGENEMEEGQMKEIEIKEEHEDVVEKQDKKFLKDFDDQCPDVLDMWKRRRIFESPFIWNLLNVERGQVEENKIKEGQEEVQEEQDNELKILRKAFGQSKRVNVITINVARRASRFLYKYMEDLEYLSKRFLKQQIQDVWQLSRCKVCLDSDACMVFFPCRHMATCKYCGSFLDQCPVCRTFIKETVKVNKK